MWRHSGNGADVRPVEVDDSSSRAYVYVRRNIERVEGDGEDIATHYEWDELAVPKEILETWETANDAEDGIIELAEMTAENLAVIEEHEAAILELAEMIGSMNGGE